MANLEIKQKNLNEADSLQQRALQIHLWAINQRETKKVFEQLVNINRKLQKDSLADSFAEQLK